MGDTREQHNVGDGDGVQDLEPLDGHGHASKSQAPVALKPARAIGGSLSALVRATALYRKGVERFQIQTEGGASETMRQVAERAAKAWRRARPNSLELEAMRITVGGDVAVRADNDHHQWVLFAFMAGVRRITPKRAMTTDDVMRLVQALVALKPTLASIEHFRDWLDADGAEGFDVRVHTSFREVIEEVDLEEEREFSKAFTMARFEVPRSGDAVWIAARDLDMVAMRKEFEMPIEMYTSGAMANAAGGMTDAELNALGVRADDANAWATAEIEAVLALPELRTAVTPEQMARRLVSRLAEEADSRFLTLLTKLNTKHDPFSQAVGRALGTQEVGEAIARQLDLNGDANVEAFGQFLVLSPPDVSKAVVGGMLDRATDDGLALDALALLSEWYGATQLCDWTVPANLQDESAAALGRALGRSLGHTSMPSAEITRIVGAAPMSASVQLLSAMPREALPALSRAARIVWNRAQGESVEPAAELMIHSAAPENLKLLGDMLLDGKLNKWRGRTLYALCSGLVKHGLGGSHALQLALKQGAPEALRLIAIDCLKRDPVLVAEACKFRFSHMFDSGAVKSRLRDIRKPTGPS